MRIILTTILMLVCLVAYSATPSYSNFSSNQFAPSGTYTVTVKDKPLLTNIVEHAQLSLTNPAFANSLVYMTNMRSLTGLTNTMVFVSSYGPQIQFAWTTNGIGLTNTVMVISNGLVGIGMANPTSALGVNGNINTVAGSVSSAQGLYAGSAAFGVGIVNCWNIIGRAEGIFDVRNYRNGGSNGVLYMVSASTNLVSQYENNTNTCIVSQGTNLYIGDGITANSSNVATMQFSFQTSGTPVMVISNGFVGIGKANPATALDMAGVATAGGFSYGGIGTANVNGIGQSAGTYFKVTSRFSAIGLGAMPGMMEIVDGGSGISTNGAALVMLTGTNDYWSAQDTVSNTVAFTEGTNFVFTDIIQSPGLNITTNWPPPAAASRIGGMYLWNSNSTHLYLLVSSPTSAAWTSTNKLFGP